MSIQQRKPPQGTSEPKEDFPWWLVFVLAIGGYLAYRIVADELYASIFTIIGKGAGVTAFVTIVAFLLASSFGLLLAIASLSGVFIFTANSAFLY